MLGYFYDLTKSVDELNALLHSYMWLAMPVHGACLNSKYTHTHRKNDGNLYQTPTTDRIDKSLQHFDFVRSFVRSFEVEIRFGMPAPMRFGVFLCKFEFYLDPFFK